MKDAFEGEISVRAAFPGGRSELVRVSLGSKNTLKTLGDHNTYNFGGGIKEVDPAPVVGRGDIAFFRKRSKVAPVELRDVDVVIEVVREDAKESVLMFKVKCFQSFSCDAVETRGLVVSKGADGSIKLIIRERTSNVVIDGTLA